MAMDITTLSVNVKSTGIDSTSQALENLAKSAEKAEKAVDKMEGKFKNSRAGIDVVKESINSLKDILNKSFPTDGANSLTKAMKELSDAMSKIKGKNINVNFKEIGDSSHQAVKGVTSLNQSLMQGHNIFQVVGKSLYNLRNLLGGTMLAGALISGASATIKFTDAWSLMNAKLKMALGSGQAANVMQEELYKSAQSLRVPVEELSKLYVRLVPAMQEYGYSTSDALVVTKAMSAALSISGATAAETASVLLQFSQAMQAGRLNGAEFNAVAEGAPIVLRAIQKELFISRKALKDMGADGEISVNLMTEVLKKYEKQWSNQAENMPLTFDKAVTKLENAFMRFVGTSENAQGGVSLLAKAVNFLAENLNTIGGGALAAITGAIVFFTLKALAAVPAMLGLATATTATGVAMEGAAVKTGLFAAALNVLKAHPVIFAISVLIAGYTMLAATSEKAATPIETANEKINEMLKLGEGAPEAMRKAIESESALIKKSEQEIESWKEKKKSAYGYQDVVIYNSRIEELNKTVEEAKLRQEEYNQALKETEHRMNTAFVNKTLQSLRDRAQILEQEIVLNKDLSSTEQKRIEAVNELNKLQTGISLALSKNAKADVKNAQSQVEEQFRVIDALNYVVGLEEKRKAQSKAEKAASGGGDSFAKKYLKQLEASKLFIDKLEEEISLKRTLTESEKEVLKVESFIANNRKNLSSAQLVELNTVKEVITAKGEELRVRKLVNQFLDDSQEKHLRNLEIQQQEELATFGTLQTIQEKIKLQEMLNNEIEQTPLGAHLDQLESDNQRINFLKSQLSLLAEELDLRIQLAWWSALESGDDAAIQRAEKAGKVIQDRIDSLNKEIKTLEAGVEANDALTDAMLRGSQIRMSEIGRTPGAILAEGFGEAGKAISNMTKAYDVFGEQSSRINAELAAQQEALKAKGFGDDSKEMIAAREAAADKQVQINAQMFASMAGAAKGFFSENSKGYQLMAKAEKAFRVLELAMATKNFLMKTAMVTQEVIAVVTGEGAKTAAEETGTVASIASSIARGTAKAAEAVASAFAAPFPLNFAAGAAMIAVMAGLGYMVGGGGGSSGPSSADRQSSQGTGTVFGDTSAKSESITNALETLSENSDISLKYNEGMLNALKNIEASLAGVGKLVVRSGIQTDLGNSDGLGKTFSSSLNKVFSAGDTVGLGMVTGGLSIILSPIKAIGNALFNTKKSLVDSGFIQNAQAFGDILNEGLDIMGYRDIETKKRRGVKTRKSTETDLVDLSDELQTQLTLAVTNIGDSVKQAAVALGMNSESFNNTLNSFVVDLGRISIQGMSSEDVQKTLTNVFSKLGDEMALAVMPGVMEFQELGEGMLETLIRVASTVATVDGIFDSIGQTFSMTGEAGLQAKMELVELAGGLENLSSLVGNFYENFYTESEKTANTARLVSEEFSRLGIEMLDLNAKDARIRFRDLVNSYKDTNSEVYLSLLGLQDKISDLVPAFDEATSSTEENLDVLNKKLSLEARLRELTMSDIELLNFNREQELLSMDASLVALQKRIWALEDERVALDKLKNAAQGALSGLEKSVGAEKTKLKKDLDDKLKVIDKLKTEENARYEAERQNIQDQARLAEDAFNATKQAQQNSVQTSLSNAQDISNSLKELFDSIAGGVDALRASTSAYTSQSYASAQAQLDSALMLAKSTGVLPDATRFKDVISSLTSVDKSSFASAFDYERNQLVTAGKLEQIQGVAGTKLSAADQTVKLLESQLRSIDSMSFSMSSHYDTLLTQAEEQHKLNIEKLEESEKLLREQYELDVFYLDGILENAKTQLEIANGSFVALTDIDTALETYNSNLTAYIEKQAGKDEILAQIGAMTNKVTSIEIPSMQVKDEELATQIKQLSDDMKAANRSIAENTLKTAKILDRWDGDGQPEQRVI